MGDHGSMFMPQIADTPYELAHYNVTITSEADPSFLEAQTVETADVLFKDMPNSASLTATITPIFNVSQHLLHRNSSVKSFDTPHAGEKLTKI